ncbi:hypothetical protein ACLOJK_014855 [Asimina triloba]
MGVEDAKGSSIDGRGREEAVEAEREEDGKREHPEKPWEEERDSTMNKKEYKAYLLLVRREVTVLDPLPLLLPVKASRRGFLRGMWA